MCRFPSCTEAFTLDLYRESRDTPGTISPVKRGRP